MTRLWRASERAAANWTGRPVHGRGAMHTSSTALRKAACRRLAEAGCSANEIAGISGHASLDEVARYTKAADQARLARNAMTRTTAAQKGAGTGILRQSQAAVE